MTELKKIKMFEPTSPNKSTGIVNGKASGVLNWDDIAYPSFYETYKSLLGNFWNADEIDMTSDEKQFPNLPEEEREAYKRIIALLATLDAPQTRLILSATEFITDPSVTSCSAVIAQQEAEHNRGYSYTLSSIASKAEQDEVFEIARTDKIIQSRINPIMKLYDEFIEDKTANTLARALAGSMVLEGINFYTGFAFFYHLAREEKMIATSTMISYINLDEMTHGNFIAKLLRAIITENPEIDKDGEFSTFIYDLFKDAVDKEIYWSEHVLSEIEGIDLVELRGYIKYRANKMLRMMGMDDIYEGVDENVMPWIKAYTDGSVNDTHTDFFEGKPRTYNKVNKDNGFDDL